jgi:peptidoglycan/LPS O-acetylase OafA/YrhL
LLLPSLAPIRVIVGRWRMVQQKERFPALDDGLRGLAIIGVLFNHLGPLSIPDGSPWLTPLVWSSKFGWTGVDLFFVLSGFLITGILFRHRKASNYFAAFYTHRALRIFLLYFLLLLIFTVIVPSAPAAIAAKGPVSGDGTLWPSGSVRRTSGQCGAYERLHRGVGIA